MSKNIALLNSLKEKYLTTFKSNPLYYKAPGRINLIGEHTDYNEGFVLPAAIDKAIYFAANKNDPQTATKNRFRTEEKVLREKCTGCKRIC